MKSDGETPIVPRRVDLGFPAADVPRHWADDPVFTRISDALSLLFPAGEQFFIQSVNLYKDGIADPELRERVRGFTYQEAQHSTAHAAYNRMLEDQGLKIGWVDRSLRRRLTIAKRFLPEVFQLAFTATAEHLTATMAEGLIASMRDQFATADPRMRALYYWHAVEEVEHKDVAWDVYERVAKGGYRRRVMAQLWVTTLVLLNVGILAAYMLQRDGLLFDFRMWRKSIPQLWGRRGFFTRMIRPYLRGFAEFVRAWQRHPDAMAATESALAATA
jgi:predicted metal-dependent hydrolase